MARPRRGTQSSRLPYHGSNLSPTLSIFLRSLEKFQHFRGIWLNLLQWPSSTRRYTSKPRKRRFRGRFSAMQSSCPSPAQPMVRRQALTSRMPSIGVLTVAVINRLQHGQHVGRPRLLALQEAFRAKRHVGRVSRRLEGLDHLHADPRLLRRISYHRPHQRQAG